MITPEVKLAVDQVVRGIPSKAIRDGAFDQKLVEIIVRQADGKISEIAKCALENEVSQQSFTKVLSKVPAIGGVNTVSSLANNVQTEMVRQEVKKVGKDVKEVLNVTKDLSVNVDKLTKGMSVVQGLSFLNTALSAANLGVSMIGFSNVNKRLDSLQDELHTMQQTVTKIDHAVTDLKNMKILEIVNNGHTLIDKAEVLFQHFSDGEYDLKECESVLGEYRTYLRYVQSLMNNGILDYEAGYQISMNLLRSYSEILKNYLIEYYYTHDGKIPSLYSSYLQTISSFAEPQFRAQLFDHVYLDCDCLKADAEKSQLCHLLLVSNAYTQVTDTEYLISQLPEKQNYLDLQDAITKDVQKRVDIAVSFQ